MGLIFSLFNVISSQDVPFLPTTAAAMLSTKTYLFSPLLLPQKLKRPFSRSPLSIKLCNGASIHENKAYWQLNFSLINGCGTRKIIFVVIPLFFEVVLTNFIIVTKNKCTEKFAILQSIGIIAIKIRETRSVIHTCRYSS